MLPLLLLLSPLLLGHQSPGSSQQKPPPAPVHCNPNIPTQLCPGGLKCPLCGSPVCLCPAPGPVPPGPPPPAPAPSPAPAPPGSHNSSRPTVLAFYVGGGPLQYWKDMDWNILTHLDIFGAVDKGMVTHARAKGALVLTGMSFGRNMSQPAVRHKLTQHVLSLRDQRPPWDGIFIDSECTEQPCPWLAPEQAAGEAIWLAEVKVAWPAGYISMYISGLADARITGCCDSDTASYPMGLSVPQMVALEPHIDQFIHAGYGAVDSDYFDSNVMSPCSTNGNISFYGCGANNAAQMISYILEGSAGSSKQCEIGLGKQSSFPCAQASWSAVVPKSKLVVGIGWYNNQVNVTAAEHGAPLEKLLDMSFCRAFNWSKHPGVVKKWQDATSTWVFDRTDANGTGMRVWYDDDVSLAPKYAAIHAAGWSGVAIWLANGMFANDTPEDHGGQAEDMSDYCPAELAKMWASIKANLVDPAE